MRRRLQTPLALAAICTVVGCFGQKPEWSYSEMRAIYAAALEAVHEEVGGPDTLFVDSRAHFLVESDDGALHMGEANRHGDARLSAAIGRLEPLVECRTEGSAGCRRQDHGRFVTISEVLPIGTREAGLLASHFDFRQPPGGVRGYVVRLRFANGTWRVAVLSEGHAAGLIGPGGG